MILCLLIKALLTYVVKGYSKFQLKLGGHFRDDIERIESCKSVLDPSDTLIGDANTGWLSHDALRVAHAVRNLDVFMEQPCPSFEVSFRMSVSPEMYKSLLEGEQP